MKELKCPNCGSMFTVDEADYASIVNQVKNAEFEEELCRRINEMKGRQDAEQKVRDAAAREDFSKKLGDKDKTILEKDQEIAKLIRDSNDAYAERDSRKMELVRLKSAEKTDVKAFEEKLARLKQTIEGQKIAQIVLMPIITPNLVAVEQLENTERGSNGFGSTGKF